MKVIIMTICDGRFNVDLTRSGLGSGATISAVLYANLNHPEWRAEFPNWPDRCKQILKKWRALPGDKKAPYLQQARDNRAAIRMKKAQQVIVIFFNVRNKMIKIVSPLKSIS
jgi:hypothetical protein